MSQPSLKETTVNAVVVVSMASSLKEEKKKIKW